MIAGRYTLEREVGRGGMGAVWLARDEVLGRAVAMKRIGVMPGTGSGSPDLVRAEREARLAARLNHPHVVAVFDLVTEQHRDGDRQWLVMEYVENVTLAQLVRRDGPMPPDRAGGLLAQAADALAAAHGAGIVHRDVKPSNILVTVDGQVKLSDFGIARAEADATLTQTGLVTGSPAYLAPEVASGQAATEASDVWALGATLFHALEGRPPYEVGDNLMGALYRIVHEEPPRAADPGWLAPVLGSTMTKDPADRWPMGTVRDFLRGGPAAGPRPAATAVLGAAADPHTTRVLAAAPPAAATPGAPARGARPAGSPAGSTASTPPPTVPGRRREGSGRRAGRPVLAVVAVVVAVVLAAVVGWIVLDPGGDPGDDRSPTATGSGPSTGPSTGNGSGSASTPAAPTEASLEQFVGDYLSTVTADEKAAFAMLTPEFQRASGGFRGYRGFWDTIRSADLVSVSADPQAMRVDYTVHYTRKDGSEVENDVSLQLVQQDGQYLIAGEN